MRRAQPAKPPKKQQGTATKPQSGQARPGAEGHGAGRKFFQSETPIAVTLTTNIKRIRGDKGDRRAVARRRRDVTPPEPTAPVVISRSRSRRAASGVSRPVSFRRSGSNFTSEAVKKTPFHGLDKPKLVNYCRNNDEYEQYILQEFQLYRIYCTADAGEPRRARRFG